MIQTVLTEEEFNDLCGLIYNRLDYGHPFFLAYCPGNQTRYELTFTPFSAEFAHTIPEDAPLFDTDPWSVVVVALTNFNTSCYVHLKAVAGPNYLAPIYLADKLKLSEGDAKYIAELLNGIAQQQ